MQYAVEVVPTFVFLDEKIEYLWALKTQDFFKKNGALKKKKFTLFLPHVLDRV
jgi:hypothetical protein